MNIPKSLRVAMAIKDVDNRQLAKKTGLTESAISLIKRGKRKPRPESLEAIADALDMSVSQLLAIGDKND